MRIKTKEIAFIAVLTAVICIIAPLSVNIGVIPLTLATFVIYLTSSLLNCKIGTMAVICYLILGMVGLPVFAGFTGGVAKLFGVTGGFLLGFLPCAFIIGLLVDRWELKFWAYPLSMFIGAIVCFAFGIVWFMILSDAGFMYALGVTVIPFIVPEIIKIAAASLLAFVLRKRLSAFVK